METNKIKGSDLVPFPKQTMLDILTEIKALSTLSDTYQSITLPSDLDMLKREFISHLERLGELYSKTRPYKGSNHNYCEEEIKKLKAQTVAMLISGGHNATNADKIAYNDQFYIDRIDAIRTVVSFFIKVETMYNHFNTVLQSIVQSVSVAGKELNQSKQTN